MKVVVTDGSSEVPRNSLLVGGFDVTVSPSTAAITNNCTTNNCITFCGCSVNALYHIDHTVEPFLRLRYSVSTHASNAL